MSFKHVSDMTCCELADYAERFGRDLESGTDKERLAMGRTAQVLKFMYDQFRKNYQKLEPLSEIEDIGKFGKIWNKDIHGKED